jgi:LacI family transcriptional regulator
MNVRPSIRDVARQAGISHTAASLALRRDPRIPAATRRRVEQTAAQLGYHRHAVLASLMAQLRTLKVKPETATLGFITSWPTREGWRSSPNHRRFFAGAEQRARELGYRLDIFWLREPGMTARRMSAILRSRGIEGLLLQSLPQAGGELKLEWRHFAAVAKGLTIARPRLHRVISSHFEDMRLVMAQLRRLGYRRPGLVLDEEHDARVDHAWLAAYLLQQQELPERDRVPALILRAGQGARQFAAWRARHQPEVVLFTDLPVPAWLAEQKVRVPRDLGLVHLDWSEEMAPLAGVDLDVEALGAAAVDLLVGQLHAHERGVPRREKIVAVSGRWVPGSSLRRQRKCSV